MLVYAVQGHSEGHCIERPVGIQGLQVVDQVAVEP